MPSNTVRSELFARYGERMSGTIEKHKHDEFDWGQYQSLPPGIDDGVARLTTITFKQIEEGKPYAGEWQFYATGSVVLPVEHGGVRCEGKQISLLETVCDTPGWTRQTVEQHFEWVVKHLVYLAGEENRDAINGTAPEVACKQLMEAKPYFTFRTFAGGKTVSEERSAGWVAVQKGKVVKGPYINKEELLKAVPYCDKEAKTVVLWGPRCDPPTIGDSTEDATQVPSPAPVRAPSATPGKVTPNGPAAPSAKVQAAPSAKVQAAPPNVGSDEFGDLETITAEAMSGNAEAERKLREMALASGIDQETIAGAPSWQDVADMILAGGSGDTSADINGQAPTVGDIYLFHPPDKTRNNAPALNPVRVVVVSVDEASETCLLKREDDKRFQYRGVRWEALQRT